MSHSVSKLFTIISCAALTFTFGVRFAFGEAPQREYPLKTCVVSGEKLGSMGKSYVHKHEGREVQFCCKSCLKDFNKDPKKYLKKLDEAGSK
jgi:YHS domain-containing protein